MRRPCPIVYRRTALIVAGVLVAATEISHARADRLAAEQIAPGDRELAPIEELSYETIIETSDRFDAMLRIRVALHNNSALGRDAVLSLALPLAAEIEDLAVARNGVWTRGMSTTNTAEPGRRDPGTVFVRQLPPETSRDIPGAELVVFQIPSGATIQVEVAVRVHPILEGERWQLELPARGHDRAALANERRVIVRGLQPGEEFWVDDQASGDERMMRTSPEHGVVVSWPAHIRTSSVFDGRAVARPDQFGGGELKLFLTLGQAAAPRPDHVVLVVDRSRSTSARLQRSTQNAVSALFASLPESTTFDAVGFARTAAPLLGDGPIPTIADERARRTLDRVLDANVREQGTNMAAAFRLVAQRLMSRKAKRPLVVVVTDGMLPAAITADEIRDALEVPRGSGRRAPEILFVVDEPLLQKTGLHPEHSIARLAAVLGARISLQTLEQMGPWADVDFLGSPRVLGDLAITLPGNVTMRDEVPPGLVAGNFVMLQASYRGSPPRTLLVRGRLGSRRISRRIAIHPSPPVPEAIGGSIDDANAKQSIAEGFALPPWYRVRDRRLAQLGITQAGRGVELRGELDKNVIRHYLRTRVLPRARVCYKHAVSRNQVQAGRVVMEIEIGKGEVMHAHTPSVNLDYADNRLVDCLTEAAWALDIPAAKLDDRVYLVRYPLTLEAPKNGVPPRIEDPLGQGTIDMLLGTTPTARGS